MNRILLLTLFITLSSFAGFAQNVGIGVPAPQHARLQINGSIGAAVAMFASDKMGVTIEADNPEIGFNYYFSSGTKTIRPGYAAYMGMIPANGDLYIGNFNGNQSAAAFGSITGAREAMRITQAGNVGIGTAAPQHQLTVRSISGAGLVQESPDATAQVGFWTGTNGAYLQTWTNTDLNFATGNGVSRMVLRTNGNLEVNKTIQVQGNISSPRSGTSGMLPIAYGKISAAGTIVTATDNVFVTRVSTGDYYIALTSEPALTADQDKYTIMATAEYASGAIFTSSQIVNGNWIVIFTVRPKIQFSNNGCNCDLFSLVTQLIAYEFTDSDFTFLVYKNN